MSPDELEFTSQGHALLHVLEEVTQHLGQMELTRDVLRAAAAGPAPARGLTPSGGRQWHAEPAQPGDQLGPLELGRIVKPVAGRRVHQRGRQQPEFVVQPQRLRGQPGGTGERANRQQPHANLPSRGHARCTRCCGFPQGQSQTQPPAKRREAGHGEKAGGAGAVSGRG